MLLLSFLILLFSDLLPLIRLCGICDHLMSVELWLIVHRRGKPEYSQQKPASIPLYAPKIPHAWDQNRTCAVRGQRINPLHHDTAIFCFSDR